MLAAGTTTCEAKSGYGLDTETELRMLRVDRGARTRSQPIELVATFMGAHEVPPEYRGRQAEFVRLVIDEMIPRPRRLAEWCDVFCDRGFFTPEESRAILDAGRRAGLKPRIHADELASSGGSAVAAARRRAIGRSSRARHRPTTSRRSRAPASSPRCCRAAAFYLKLGRFAPARDLIAAGVPVALATDVNPGGGFSPSMPFAMTLACFGMGMTFEEALARRTINGAVLARSRTTASAASSPASSSTRCSSTDPPSICCA